MATALSAQTFTRLHSFQHTDGQQPVGGLVQGTDGSLYGTTFDGVANGPYGTVFKIALNGTLTNLYSFCSLSGCTDGSAPFAALVQATNGDFYGTTYVGGANTQGTVFKITPSGTLTTLYSFCSQSGCTDGGGPSAALVQATNGNLYGATYTEGAGHFGTIFEITPGGTLTTLHSFAGHPTDGAGPQSALIQAIDGNLYGTTTGGGTHNLGTIFKMTPDGTFTTLHNFDKADGVDPSGLVQATNGNFYGTTGGGGANNQGTVFEVTASGTLTTLYNFCPHTSCADGAFPTGALVQATDGNFYGTTMEGGIADAGEFGVGAGTVFQITPSGTLTTLYSFCPESSCTDGDDPFAGLVQDTNGTFYGTTEAGGAYNFGAVFSVSVGLGPFVKTQPAAGEAGELVKILGSALTGASSVTFNGAAAVFTVVSPFLITATVPAGASSGEVEVTIPSGTLASNVAFRVRP
jgi:uncharacterized repeat protein (TIGR03803 family)